MKTLTNDEVLEILGTDPLSVSPDQIGWLSPECAEVIKLEHVPILENPYTKILAAIETDGCKLEMASWHSGGCGTTHCVGGWTCHLAPDGKAFENRIGDTGLAAQMILRASRPDAPLPNFTASNEAAMAFIRARAKEEAK